jgi:hypothetical protein
MWTLRIVMLQKVLSHRSYLFQGRRPMDLQALLVLASMIAFDVGMASLPAAADTQGSHMKILMYLRTEKDGSACIYKVEDLNHPAFVCLLDRREQCSRRVRIHLDLF